MTPYLAWKASLFLARRAQILEQSTSNDRGELRHAVKRLHHLLGRDLADTGHLDGLSAQFGNLAFGNSDRRRACLRACARSGRGYGCIRRRDHVFLADTSANAGTGNAAEVNAAVGRQLAHDRRDVARTARSLRCLGGLRGCCSGCNRLRQRWCGCWRRRRRRRCLGNRGSRHGSGRRWRANGLWCSNGLWCGDRLGCSNGRGGLRLHGRSIADAGEHCANGRDLVFGDEDLGQGASERRRNLGVDLVRRHLDERFVDSHRVPNVLEPPRRRCPRSTDSPSAGRVTSRPPAAGAGVGAGAEAGASSATSGAASATSRAPRQREPAAASGAGSGVGFGRSGGRGRRGLGRGGPCLVCGTDAG